MIAFPIIAFLISAACAAVVALDAWKRPKPDKIAWTIAFALFAIAAGAEVAGSLAGWSPMLARVYYLAGAVLVVGYLALGELYLLAPARVAKVAPGAAILVTALAATAVMNAPVNEARLALDGWRAIERGPGLVTLTVLINALGTAVLAGGALWSAWQFRGDPALRSRVRGLVLIAAGTLVVAAGGSLTRLGRHEYLYIAMSAGVALIFAGYLQARKPPAATVARPDVPEPVRLAALGPAGVAPVSRADGSAEGLALISAWLSDLDDAAIAARCAEWSATPGDELVLDRDWARQAWALRLGLDAAGRERFDALPPAVRRQLAEVQHEVFAAGVRQAG